jgi:hypothetical protein
MRRGLQHLLFICLFACTYTASAQQFGLGFQFLGYGFSHDQGTDENGAKVAFHQPPGGSGLGIQGFYILKQRMRFIFSLSAMNTRRERTEYDFTDPHSNTKIFYYDVQHPFSAKHLEFQYAFTGNFIDKGLKFFGIAALAENTFRYTMNHGSYTKLPDGTIISETAPIQVRKYRGVSLEAGLGLEYAFNPTTHLFVSCRLGTGRKTKYSSAKLNNGYLLPDVFSPSYISTEIGMRFNLHKKAHS